MIINDCIFNFSDFPRRIAGSVNAGRDGDACQQQHYPENHSGAEMVNFSNPRKTGILLLHHRSQVDGDHF